MPNINHSDLVVIDYIIDHYYERYCLKEPERVDKRYFDRTHTIKVEIIRNKLKFLIGGSGTDRQTT